MAKRKEWKRFSPISNKKNDGPDRKVGKIHDKDK